jgi:hypothetical protein
VPHALAFVALWHHKRNNLWLALSGFVLALSVLIKLFTGLLVPVFLIGISAAAYFDSRDEGFSWKMLRPALIWSVCFAGLTILLGLVLVVPKMCGRSSFRTRRRLRQSGFRDLATA